MIQPNSRRYSTAIRDKFTAKMYKRGKEREKTSLFSGGAVTYVENLNKLPYN